MDFPRRYIPTVSEQLAQLADATDGIVHATAELRRNPNPDAAERLATWLGGAQRTAARVAHQLAAEQRGVSRDG